MQRAGISRRQIFHRVAIASALVALGMSVIKMWLLGRNSIAITSPTHRLTGGSMAPTYWGEHYDITCSSCQVRFKIDASPTSSLAQNNSSRIRCWHCGDDFDRPSGPTRPGDIVEAKPLDKSTALHRGDLVVIQVDNDLHLKRILGIPGDRISIADNGTTPLQLSVNNESAVSTDVTVPVDRDALRKQTRWSNWQRLNTTWHCTATASPSPSLVYTHHNVHAFDKVTVVMDDCPANPLIARPLYPVSKLQLRFQISCSASITLVTTFGTRECDPGMHNVVFHGANADVSISVIASDHDSDVQISGLELDRYVDYRLRRTDDQSSYPLKLATSEYYVVGDNVPISVDSRDFGPVQRSQIVSIVRHETATP
jgi:type IV secretory pathway protease TraF